MHLKIDPRKIVRILAKSINMLVVISFQLHCNPNAQENLDHLSTNVSEQDDRSKLAIEGKIGFYWNLRYES